MKSKNKRLSPPLPFGTKNSITFNDFANLSEQQTASARLKIEYRPLKRDDPFQFAFSAAQVEDLRLVAASSTPMRFSTSDSPRGIVMLPMLGHCQTRRGQRSIEWGQGRAALYLPPGNAQGESGARSIMGIDIDPGRLETIARTMLGDRPEADRERIVDWDTPRPLKLAAGNVNFDQIFRHYAELLDLMGADLNLLTRLGISEMILRSTIMLTAPHLFLDTHTPSPAAVSSKVKLVCDYIEAHLEKKITLTDLEGVSGLSARGLQYAFRSAMNVSPIQWITDRRLDAVRRLLLVATAEDTVIMIASQYFTHMGNFARLYKTRYGETPSETLSRQKKRRL
ncbi:helix-turn-helix transcriptional regulator [Aquabacter cavernae]|uniref:helix-turn-helix transcriptional regulator n=1 Tax=Aquabacter cavernae TaxID=2496029 RepID=UPI001FE1C99E|nr:helix-turn-helix transcriptional regulator [Aquabacter cavernae]